MPKAQSAIEFMSGYGFVFLIIAIALALLFIFSKLPSTVLPTQCTFLSGFSCGDAIYTNTVKGSSLFIQAIDTQPGVVNISSFTAYINYQPSTSGYCAPNVAVAGQTVYCIANFTFRPVLGNLYSGSFKLSSAYCSSGASNLSLAPCHSSGTYTYGGDVRVQASFFPITGTYVVPVTLSNTQSQPYPAYSQVEVQFPPSTYGAYERGDLGNVRFYYGASELDSWCEANCTSASAANAIFWVKMPVPIPAPASPMTSSNAIISMYFMPTTTEYDGQYAGEAPQLSDPIYARFDNGQNVFAFYDNFAGASLSSLWTSNTPSGTTITVSNGITVATGSSSTSGGIVGNAGFTPPYILEANVISASGVAAGMEWQNGPTPTSNGYSLNYWSGSISGGSMTNGFAYSGLPALQIAPGVMGLAWVATGSYYAYENYVATHGTDSHYSLPGTVYPSLGIYSSSPSSSISLRWVRVRSYQPNGVQPALSFGTLAKVSNPS